MVLMNLKGFTKGGQRGVSLMGRRQLCPEGVRIRPLAWWARR